jgi:parallel beta-helix repeat protein
MGRILGKAVWKTLVVALVITFIVSGSSGIVLGGNLLEYSGSEVISGNYTVRDPIRINGNTDFAAQAAAEGWSGDGSEGNPYIIEGYEIDGTNYEHCIFINNTNVYFELRSNYVHESKYGIYFEKVQNSIIADNIISNHNYSIDFRYSNRNVISNNTISDNVVLGIHLLKSNNNTISNNTASNQKYGVAIAYSDENIIANNTISNSSEVGVIVTEDGTLIHSNDIRDNIYINNTRNYDVVMTVPGENGEGSSGIPPTYIILAFVFVAIFMVALVMWKRKKSNREGE